MTLIKCPECGKNVSDTVDSCIHCGYKIMKNKSSILKDNNKIDETKNDMKIPSIVKDIFLIFLIFGPVLFIIIGGSIWTSGGFEGTFMQKLFPAVFWGFILLIPAYFVSYSIFERFPIVWKTIPILIFLVSVVLYLLNLLDALSVLSVILISSLLLLILIKWLKGDL